MQWLVEWEENQISVSTVFGKPWSLGQPHMQIISTDSDSYLLYRPFTAYKYMVCKHMYYVCNKMFQYRHHNLHYLQYPMDFCNLYHIYVQKCFILPHWEIIIKIYEINIIIHVWAEIQVGERLWLTRFTTATVVA